MRDVCSEENASVDAVDITRAHRHTGSQSLSQFTSAGESSLSRIHALRAHYNLSFPQTAKVGASLSTPEFIL